MGSAAVGVPALINALVSRRARRLPAATWGSGDRYAWKGGDVGVPAPGRGRAARARPLLRPGHSSTEWRRAAEVLAADYRVHVPDLPGWGQSVGRARRPTTASSTSSSWRTS